MTVDLVTADVRGTDRDALMAFLTRYEWPFHVRVRRTPEEVGDAIAGGAFDDDDHATSWVVDRGRRVGLVVLEDVTDDTPLFDLRIAEEERGRGLGLAALRALTDHVFTTRLRTDRLEGQTREDNAAMRRTFRRAGFVKEAHYREAWPTDDGRRLAAIGYGMLRRDWESGGTTRLDWDDEPAGRS